MSEYKQQAAKIATEYLVHPATIERWLQMVDGNEQVVRAACNVETALGLNGDGWHVIRFWLQRPRSTTPTEKAQEQHEVLG